MSSAARNDIITGLRKMKALPDIFTHNRWYVRIEQYLDTNREFPSAPFEYNKYKDHPSPVNKILEALEMPEKDQYAPMTIPRHEFSHLFVTYGHQGGGA